jgi:2-iminobutanoate/2-iminopropanoate deaminase
MKKILLLIGLLMSSSYAVAANNPPFSEAVKVGNTLYLSGQIGTLSLGAGPVPGGIVPETRQAMENIKRVLEKYHYSMGQVKKCTIMMADMREWGKMNEVYATFFSEGKYPARSAFGATGLAYNARVEIECMAAK